MKRLLVLLIAAAASCAFGQSAVKVGGLLGEALDRSQRGRLRTFVEDERSRPIAIFSPAARAKNLDGDWNGEHAGKWLYTASRSAARTGDAELAKRVRRVADYLLSTQEPDGYLGTYAPAARLTSDDAYNKRRTWDVWVLGYTILGLVEAGRQLGESRYLKSAAAIGQLCERTLGSGTKSAAYMGNHVGSSGTVLLEPIVELYFATGETHFLDFAKTIVRQMDERKGLEIFSLAFGGKDVGSIGDGKAYQLEWNFLGLAKLARATGDPRYQKAAMNAWTSIHDQHLTPGGGPWGGIGRHTETFNEPGFFSPNGFVETCNSMSWIQLNEELLRATGEARFAQEIERTAYNDLLAAQHPNGEDWAYFVFPNGKRTATYYWACCKSSGALALEEVAGAIYSARRDGIAVNLFAPSEAKVSEVALRQETRYPFEGKVSLWVEPKTAKRFSLYLRIPDWATGASVKLNGKSVDGVRAGHYLEIAREWGADRIDLDFPAEVQMHSATQLFRQEGAEVSRADYRAFSVGALVYATGLIDGYKRSESIMLPPGEPAEFWKPAPAPSGVRGPAFRMAPLKRPTIVFVPSYEAGGWNGAAWRTTWLEIVQER